MGKLHSLKRAILRNPNAFKANKSYYPFRYKNGNWKQGWYGVKYGSYNHFIVKILGEIGNADTRKDKAS